MLEFGYDNYRRTVLYILHHTPMMLDGIAVNHGEIHSCKDYFERSVHGKFGALKRSVMDVWHGQLHFGPMYDTLRSLKVHHAVNEKQSEAPWARKSPLNVWQMPTIQDPSRWYIYDLRTLQLVSALVLSERQLQQKFEPIAPPSTVGELLIERFVTRDIHQDDHPDTREFLFTLMFLLIGIHTCPFDLPVMIQSVLKQNVADDVVAVLSEWPVLSRMTLAGLIIAKLELLHHSRPGRPEIPVAVAQSVYERITLGLKLLGDSEIPKTYRFDWVGLEIMQLAVIDAEAYGLEYCELFEQLESAYPELNEVVAAYRQIHDAADIPDEAKRRALLFQFRFQVGKWLRSHLNHLHGF
jgi:hypothetical protein